MAKHRWNPDCNHGSFNSPARGYLYTRMYTCTKCKQVSVVPPYRRDPNGRIKRGTKVL